MHDEPGPFTRGSLMVEARCFTNLLTMTEMGFRSCVEKGSSRLSHNVLSVCA